MASAPPALPHWDMTTVYPDLQSPQFEEAFQSCITAIADLTALFDRYGIARRERAPLDDASVEAFEVVVARFDAVLRQMQTIMAYIHGFVATDSRDDAAQARQSEAQQFGMRLEQLNTRFIAWLGSLDVEALIARSAAARDHAYLLTLAQQEAAHMMSPGEEALATELDLTSGTAWGELHSNLTSQIMVRVEGQPADLPMSAVRNLALDPDRQTRRRAYEAELAAWERSALPLAAALNSIKGEVNTLSARRGWESPLDASLLHNHIDRQTLDAMLSAAREAFPDFRRYLRAKARALGVPALAWYDLFAPVGTSSREWTYEEAERFIDEQFGGYSPQLRALARRAFAERWIDAEPRPGKRGGGFCMSLRGEESRILVNYSPTFDAVSTLAHELGHAYHNLNLSARTMLQRDTPMALAETASTFCETIIQHAGLDRGGSGDQLALLEGALQGHCGIVVDISSRFLFEQRLFEARRRRELSIDDLNQLMLEAQRETYGDGLDGDLLHPYMWAVKGHYYSTDRSFYNYPYMFGLLFGVGLYARYRRDPETFRARYDDLLSSTGLADAATLAARFDIDIRTPDFWRSSLDVMRADIDRFEALIAETR